MAKYRSLSTEELKSLEKEFVDYLVVQGIDAAEWIKIKEEDPEKAEKIIELFSDVVYEKVLRQSAYLIRFTKKILFAFYYGEELAELIILDIDNILFDDISKEEDVLDTIKKHSEKLRLNSQSKTYKKERTQEMFDMLGSGALFSSGEIFNYLKNKIGS